MIIYGKWQEIYKANKAAADPLTERAIEKQEALNKMEMKHLGLC